MEKRSIIHMIDPMPHNSPFDLNMAADAGFEVLLPYSNVKLEEVNGLVQDAIFSRGPAGVKRTGVFIGGRDIGLAMGMLDKARKAMVPPFEVSVFADPSGAFTTAAALVACVERELKNKHGLGLEGQRAVVFGGTGPVGLATGVIASLAGADTTIIDPFNIETALQKADEYNALCGSKLHGTYASSDADKARLLAHADIVFCTAKAGVQVLSAEVLADALQLKVAGDVNAVPPLGIEGLKLKHFGEPLVHAVNSKGAVGIGALAVGDVKYRLQHRLLALMLETEKPVYLDFRDAFQKARELV
ncbi:NAD(P)-dependent methylenetetrahydromethanopterin dehydrogenase [Methylococcus sp. EFPC2]|uniref:NAD(P)-dependent methylenetetrahydromethanopterin dehydrogenase n=1 Tax=Methylococcus sp. EFPC2 TaxID=2812648 RepID=UPI0019678E1E|nr:NAD(P)-dependent methylenetetrahydromethanopterin dehydrogenase [Methylococcus sp. EFPC2]QSA96758.1 methylenetetrahydromethanopterin dehydrogenase [Methylococcus sp. EFPC2]